MAQCDHNPCPVLSTARLKLGVKLAPRAVTSQGTSPSFGWLFCLLLLALLSGGCAAEQYVRVREVPRSPLVDQLKLTSKKGPRPSDRTMQLLRQWDLTSDLEGYKPELFTKLRGVLEREPSADKLHAYAELNFLAGKFHEAKDEKVALDFYGSSVVYAYLYLFDERFGISRNPYDPQFRGACDLYNGALESGLRLVKKQGALKPGVTHSVQSAKERWDVTVVGKGAWTNDEFDRFEFVSDYEVQGLTNEYRSYGLGVPLIAVRKRPPTAGPDEKYYPDDLSFPVSAFLRLVPDERGSQPGSGGHFRAQLELYDPLVSTDIMVSGRRVPLESDLSTPLGYFLNDPQLNTATHGLLHPDTEARGIYMLEPYSPGKIPVLMVHGLWSSPLTWMEMFNDLRSVPVIRDHYQFWFYLYPTGQPFWTSATELRRDLAQLRLDLDPHLREPALDQMVLVGHSMGGLVARMQVIESGNDFWNIVSDKPFSGIKADERTRNTLENVFFFHPNPAIRRVITIATPHHGSQFASNTARYFAQKMISLPNKAMKGGQQLYRDNPGLFRDASVVEVKTSIDSLAPDCPIFPVLLNARTLPGVKFHNIIGVIPNEGWLGSLAKDSDGVVSTESAHLDNADSEIFVDADHVNVHRHALSVLEVRRVLLEHLTQLQYEEQQRHAPLQASAIGNQAMPLFGPPPRR